MRRIGWLVLLVGLVAATGCQTTGDPTKGGLWGWSEDKAQQRIDERESHKLTLEEEQRIEEERTAALEAESAEMRAQRDALVSKTVQMDEQLASLQTRIRSAKVQTEEAKKEQWDLYTQARSLQSRLTEARSAAATSPDLAAKQEEVKRLEAEMDRLLQEAEALSTL